MQRILTRVVLPAPFGPRSPKSSPFFMVRFRLSMALMVWFLNLYVFVRLIVWMVFWSFTCGCLCLVCLWKIFVYCARVDGAIKFF